jgi:hypothetical protein
MILPMKTQFLPLRILCVAGWFGAFGNIFQIYSPPVWQVGAWFPAYICVSTTVLVVALGGLWALRRWAIALYALYAVINQSVCLLLHQWSSAILILPVLTLAAVCFYYRKMK